MSCSKVFFALSVSAAVLLLACGGPDPTVISGTVLGHDGEPMVAAGVRVSRWSMREETDSADPGAVFQTVEDGSFHVETFETGLLAVRLVGVYHEERDVPIYADTATHVELDVRLGTSAYPEEFQHLLVGGSFNDYDPGSAPLMEKQVDGLYTVEIETTDSVMRYMVGYRAGVRPKYFAGTESEEYNYGSYGYESVIRPAEGSVAIEFDPTVLPRVDREADVSFRAPDSFAARFASLHDEARKRMQDYRDAQSDNEDTDFSYDWTETISEVEGEITSEQDPVLRQLLLLNLLEIVTHNGAVATELVARGMQEISATSPIWSLMPGIMLDAVAYLAHPTSTPSDSFSSEHLMAAIDSAEHWNSADAPAALVARVLNEHHDPGVQADLLSDLLWCADDAGDTVRVAHYFDRIVSEHPGYHLLDYLTSVYSPDRNIVAGKNIPDFSVTSLEDSTVFHTRNDLLGSVFLIDFWATWCVPCMGELPNLHEAYEGYKDQGFQILSVALRDDRDAIADFRMDEWPMPWLHAFHGWEDDAVAPFEVEGIPRAILVDADGVILASDYECRGERLHETLERVLGGR